MAEFILRTRTERVLYIEALLSCLDAGTLSETQANHDLQDIVGSAPGLRAALAQDFGTRIEGIIAAYRGRAIDQKTAADNLVALLQQISPETADEFPRFGA